MHRYVVFPRTRISWPMAKRPPILAQRRAPDKPEAVNEDACDPDAAMKLAELLTDDAVWDARFGALEVGGISADSRTIKRGDVFVAVAGAKDDGLRFVGQA